MHHDLVVVTVVSFRTAGSCILPLPAASLHRDSLCAGYGLMFGIVFLHEPSVKWLFSSFIARVARHGARLRVQLNGKFIHINVLRSESHL